MSENEHKVGDLVVRVEWHQKWNFKQKDICYGTLISINDSQYTVHWWDDYIITKRVVVYNTKQIREMKRILYQWILKANENR